MSSVDERIVKMQFDNDTFKKKAAETQKSLADVNKSVDATGKSRGLMDLNSGMQKVSVTASKMAVVTTTALANIANKAVNAGLALVNSLTFDPIRQGFNEYGQLLNKQTVIMNATGKSGKEVKKVLRDLNTYSDTTIFSFSDMTEALTSFVNAGIPLGKASKAMQGIANASALAGASTVEAQSSFRAFSQALGQGFLGLQDYRQAAVTGKIGTVQFKQELIDTAVSMGTLTKRGNEYITSSGKALTATKGFDLSLQDQWASAEVLNTALGHYADRQSELGEKAFKAAQDVRTFSAFMDTLKESLGSGWAQIFGGLFGGVKSNIRIWSGLSNAISEVTGRFFTFAETTLKTWRKMGGLEKTIQTIQNVLAPFKAILKAIGDAWSEAFPSSDKGAGKTLYGISAALEFMTRPLVLLAKVIEGSTPILKVFFQIIKIGAVAIGNAVGYVTDFVTALFGLAKMKTPTSGGLIDFAKDVARNFANAVDKVSDLLAKGKSLSEAFGSVNINLPTLPSLPNLPVIGNLFGGADKQEATITKLSGGVKGLTKNMTGLKTASDKVDKTAIFQRSGPIAKKGFQEAGSAARDFGADMVSAGSAVKDLGGKMEGVGQKIQDFLTKIKDGFSVDNIVYAFNSGILATIGIGLARFFLTFGNGFSQFMKIGKSINDVLDEVGGAFKNFGVAQKRAATAKLILNLAIAVGVLAVSLWILSKIPMWDLVKAFIALAGVMGLIDRSVKSLTKLFRAMQGQGLSAAINMTVVAGAIVALALSMVLMATALRIMDKVDWSTVVAQIAVMYAMMKTLERLSQTVTGVDWAKMLAAGAALVGLGFAMILMATALLIFQKIKWESLGKAGAALAGMTVALGGLVALTKGPWGAAAMAAAGASFAAAALGMIALANALILFSFVKWSAIKKAGVALLGLALGMTIMVLGAASGPGMLLAAVGLNALALALMLFAKVDWSAIPKMMVAMAGFGLALLLITPALYLAAPALLLFGIAVAAMGAGLLAFATAMTLAIAIGGAGAVALSALAVALVAAIGLFLQNLALQAPVMKQSILSIIQTVIDTIVEAVPMVIDGMKRLWEAIRKELGLPEKKKELKDNGKSWIENLIDGIEDKLPFIIDTGVRMFNAFLRGLEKNIDETAKIATDLAVKFIDGIDGQDISAAGVGLIGEFIAGVIEGLGDLVVVGYQAALLFMTTVGNTLASDDGAMGDATAKATEAFVDLGIDIIGGLAVGLAKGIAKHSPVGIVTGLIGDMVSAAKKKADSHSPSRKFIELGEFMTQGLSIGVQNYAAAAITAIANVVSGQIAMATRYISSFVQQLDQTAIAAMAKAAGLAQAAQKASDIASKTKSRKDDRRADKLQKKADKAQEQAERDQERADRAREDADRQDEYKDKSTLERAQMRSEDAQTAFDRAKEYEASAAQAIVAAQALERQIKGKANTAAEKKLQAEANRLRQQAAEDAALANAELAKAGQASADALALQTQAGAEAAAAFEKMYKDEAEEAAKAEAFEKLSNAEKAKQRREEAAALQAKADADLEAAKKLAYTDLEAANELAQQALDEAQQSRDYLKEAVGYETNGGGTGGGGALGTVVDLSPTEAAALAFNEYADSYSAAVAAASRSQTIEFNQYNSSPDPLNPTEVYRQTNNQLAFASEKLADVA